MEDFQQINDLLTDSSFFYTIAIGMDRKYTYVSNNYNRNFDQSNGSLLGKEFSVTLHPDDIHICAEVGAQCFEHPGKLFPATLRKHNGLGGFVVTQWEMKAYYDSADQPAGIFCIGYNITEYVDTRTKLDDANQEIDIKNDKLSEIGFIQSHVIRKPLANIMGLASVLDPKDMDENHRAVVEKLVASAKELDMMIKEISSKTG